MATTSFIKIYGPPLLKSIKELEKIAVDMPEVCIMNTSIAWGPPSAGEYETDVMGYFAGRGISEITTERCSNIISKSGQKLGEYDFFFEWFTEPTMEQLNQLIEKIDESLAPLGCKYTITTK